MKAKVLFYDLEISPMLIRTYRTWKTFKVGDIVEDPHIMCFSYRWLGHDTTHIVSQPDFKLYKKEPYNDLEVVKKLHSLLDEADIAIAHNALGFDNKVSNARFIYHGLTPPSPFKTVDTCKIAKDRFMFPSNHLNDLGLFLGVGKKTKEKHSDLWEDCLKGDLKAWSKMEKYCKQDTKLLFDVYFKMRPYIQNHPNIALIEGKEGACPKCGSNKLQYRGFQRSAVATYHRVQCQDCGAWSRERLSDKDIIKPNYVNC